VPDSTLSRRMSEFAGVALFALALIWLISLGSYSAADPVWYFKDTTTGAPTNFAGRIGAFMAEASFQLLGYAAWVMPILIGIAGWNAFWCHKVEAAYTKLVGAIVMATSVAALLSLLSHAFGTSRRGFAAGGALGDWFAGVVADFLNVTGGTILLVVLLALSVILSTQFSFGRALRAIGQISRTRISSAGERLQTWRETRRRDKERQQVVEKHLKKAGKKAVAAAPDAAAKLAADDLAVKPARAKTPPDRTQDAKDNDNADDDVQEMPVRATKPPAIKIGRAHV